MIRRRPPQPWATIEAVAETVAAVVVVGLVGLALLLPMRNHRG